MATREICYGMILSAAAFCSSLSALTFDEQTMCQTMPQAGLDA
jgi:hypothetical protein